MPHATRDKRKLFFSTTGLSPSLVQDSAASFTFLVYNVSFPTTPIYVNWFRLVPVRSPLLRESRLLSFPPATKMFQFTGLLLAYL